MTKLDWLKEFGQKNKPTILAGMAVVGVWVTVYHAFKAAPVAEEIVAGYKRDFKEAEKEDKPRVAVDTIKEVTPVVAPPIIFGALTTACIIGSHEVAMKRLATLSVAYTLVEESSRNFRNKLEEVDRAKAQRVRELVAKDHMEDVASPDEFVETTGNGNVLCYDEYTDKYFYSCAESIGEAILKVSYRLQSEMWVSLNDFRFELGLKPCKMGDDLGWNIDKVSGGRIPVYYTAMLTDTKQPCLVVQYDVQLRERGW